MCLGYIKQSYQPCTYSLIPYLQKFWNQFLEDTRWQIDITLIWDPQCTRILQHGFIAVLTHNVLNDINRGSSLRKNKTFNLLIGSWLMKWAGRIDTLVCTCACVHTCMLICVCQKKIYFISGWPQIPGASSSIFQVLWFVGMLPYLTLTTALNSRSLSRQLHIKITFRKMTLEIHFLVI